MKKIINKCYGIKKSGDHWLVCTDIEVRPNNEIPASNRVYAHIHTDLAYKKLNFALQKAESFTKNCYKDFTNFLGDDIHFTFENKGIIQE